jgi:hypothetical protein
MSDSSAGFEHPRSEPVPAQSVISEPPGLFTPRRNPVSWRSILFGLLGVLVICGLTPYNDFVMGNTFLVGNFMPIGLLLVFMVILMLINAPLHLLAPRHALTSGELAVALGMVLISSTLPSSGLMRYLPSTMVGMNYHASSGGDRLTVLQELNLPEWMFPEREGEDLKAKTGSEVIRDFYGRSSAVAAEQSYFGSFQLVPWGAWLKFFGAWAVLIFGLYGAILCLMIIVRRQWADNERLAFPLATVYSSLIETPPPGKALAPLFRSYGFWITFVAVFIIHSFNALNKYNPQVWPEITIKYDLGSIFGEEPWKYMEWGIKSSALYFSVIGFTYFLQTNIAFSLWFTFIFIQLLRMQMGMLGTEMSGGMEQDQTMGAVLVFAATIVWIGRHHWWMVMKQMVRPPRGDEPGGRYLPYFLAGWGFVGCVALMVAWLMTAGMSLVGAIFIIGMVLTMLLVIARVVAETGLIFVQINLPLIRPMVYALNDMPDALTVRAPLRDYFFVKLMERMFTHDMREAVSPYAVNALRVADLQAYETERRWGKTLAFTACLVLALAFGYVVAGASMLYTEYSHASMLDTAGTSPINGYGIDSTSQDVLDRTNDFRTGTGPKENHNRLLNFGIGGTVTAALGALRLRFASWPLHPVGYLLVFSYPLRRIWFSLFIGWLAKALLVKYGGATLYKAARPYFIGMIIGEAAVAAFWLLVGLIRNAQGLPFEAINLLPT